LGGARRTPGADRDIDGAEKAYQLAIGLEADPAVRHFLQQRRSALCAVSSF
jgi:predicted RNA polymerase sigma factor